MKINIRKPIALLLIGTLLLSILTLTGHSESRASGEGIRNPRTTDGVTTWDCVWFGNYWQEDTNGDGSADKNLDVQSYNDTFTDVTWETCAIKTTTVVNEDNPEYRTEGGNDTQDKVLLLSIGEATDPSYGFPSTKDSTDTREAGNTKYVADGGEVDSSSMGSAGSTDCWWLRSPGFFSYIAFICDLIGQRVPVWLLCLHHL